ncbi:ATP-dependent Clp protease proteolytic subunit 5, chloroplastic-like isoform X2 [Rhododendron vialii]|uniref:ATP-dependent Clp protease proteolytic subunit 5, chloroplastic-like isoform X2 n=1 Tax=Rhododendron vialii TaxID=182163 RepID=UPI00265E2CAB|nr:ATP-dependent Clp protease proteolytic subunit 5, chloroplastic-like isoform X2 [Rhododendron vialii]
MMAQPCVFTSAASASSSLIRFNTASPIPSSCSDTTTLSLPSHHRFLSSKLRYIPVDQRNARNYAVKKGLKSVYSGGLWESNWSSCQGISSISVIRDDLQVPSSHHFQVNNVYGEEGPPPVVQEGLQFVASKLFEHRIIRCGGPVDADMANFIVAQLLYLDAVDPNKDIVMYVNSPGGSVTAGMAIFDMMRHIRPDVSTVCVGLAASMGAFLLAAGTKGKRYSLPDSRIMIQQPLSGAQGFATQINIQADEIAFHKANLTTYLALFSGQNIDQVYRDTDKDNFMSPKEAKEYGLIDGIIMNPRKALQPLAASAASADQ